MVSTAETAVVSVDEFDENGPYHPVGIPGQMTRTGLMLPDGLSFQEWDEVGRILNVFDDGVQWWIGDWLNYGERKYGETYVQAEAITGRKNQTLRHYKFVANQIELFRRRNNLSWSHHQEVSSLEPDDQDAWLELSEANEWNRNDLRQAMRDSGSDEQLPSPNGMAIHYSSDSPEWYTPPHIVDRVARAMGGIDLDPCSNSHDTPSVPATRVFTADDDGLSQDWEGRVYMNPPYGKVIEQWVEKLSAEYEDGRVREAIALVPARTDTAWFRRFPTDFVCFINGRLTFSDANAPAPFPSALVYLGSRSDRFVAVMDDIGVVFRRAVVDV